MMIMMLMLMMLMMHSIAVCNCVLRNEVTELVSLGGCCLCCAE